VVRGSWLVVGGWWGYVKGERLKVLGIRGWARGGWLNCEQYHILWCIGSVNISHNFSLTIKFRAVIVIAFLFAVGEWVKSSIVYNFLFRGKK
jgi:hypothetical protein